MPSKKTYQELSDNNARICAQIDKLNARKVKNYELMIQIENKRVSDIKKDFFKEKNSVKIEISNAFDLNVVTELAKSNPVKFVEKYLKQYKPKYSKSDDVTTHHILHGRGKIKKQFYSERAYNNPYNNFKTACHGILITAGLFEGGAYDRNWNEASITINFNGDKKNLEYNRNYTAAEIYKTLLTYNRSLHKVK